jgi:hypothetical protein
VEVSDARDCWVRDIASVNADSTVLVNGGCPPGMAAELSNRSITCFFESWEKGSLQRDQGPGLPAMS